MNKLMPTQQRDNPGHDRDADCRVAGEPRMGGRWLTQLDATRRLNALDCAETESKFRSPERGHPHRHACGCRVRKPQALQPQRGVKTIAQGTALGPGLPTDPSPEGAQQRVADTAPVTPFQGLGSSCMLDPGRCPGLSSVAPLGLVLAEFTLLTILPKATSFLSSESWASTLTERRKASH
jgi:hypothetical protein